MSNSAEESTRTGRWGGILFGLVGLALGIPAGYVINDLTSIENEEVIEAMEADEQVQEELDDFFERLAEEADSAPQQD